MIVLLVIVLLLILLTELPILIQEKLYKDMAVFMAVFVMGATLIIANFYNLPIPNPFEAIAPILANYK